MTRRIAPLIALLGVLPLFAQRPTAPKPAPQPAPIPWANKLFLPDIKQNPRQDPPATVDHDFGTVPFGAVVAHTFPFTNIYDLPIQVIDIRTECGCLTAFPPNKVLAPNEQAEFGVTMNAGAFKGANTKKLLVTVFGPQRSDTAEVRHVIGTAELRLTAVSRADVAVTPGRIDFGVVPQGGRQAKEVKLKYTGKERNWAVGTDHAVSGTAFDVGVAESARGFLGAEYTVTATLKDTAPAGTLSETITLKTNDPATPLITVGVSAVVKPPIEVSPTPVVFRGVAPGKTETQRVMIKAKAPFTLTAVPDAGDGVSVEPFPEKMAVNFVTVRYAPTKAGEFRKEIKLKTDLPGNPEAVLVVEAK